MTRWMAIASSLVISGKNARAIASSCSRSGVAGIGREQRGRQQLLALGLDRGGEQRFLVAEVAVDGELGDAGLGRDLIHADAVEAVRGEHALGRVEDRGALAQVLRAPRAGGLGVGGLGRGRMAVMRRILDYRFDIYTSTARFIN